MAPSRLVAFSILALSSSAAAISSITWLKHQRSALVKLDIPGDSTLPALPAAILLKLELSPDNKTLLIEDTPFLPLQNYYIPPRLSAYEATVGARKGAVHAGDAESEGKKDAHRRRLELDYDRLVDADPTGGPPYYSHQPALRLRIMGYGLEGKDVLLDPKKQFILQVNMKDLNEGGWSNDAARSYIITDINVLNAEEIYADLSTALGDHMGPAADQEKECTRKNWKCPDEGVFEAGNPYRTPYRFIWRRRFDQYGRIGSLRHDFVEQWDISKQKAYNDPRNSALIALGILLATVLAIVTGLKARAQRSALAKQAKEKSSKKSKKPKTPKADGEAEDEEEDDEDEDEDAAWMGEMARQAGEVNMTVDEASNLIDLMSDNDEDLDAAAAIPEAKPKKKSKNANKRVAFVADKDE